MYSISIDIKGRACLVVGGGAVALRKIEGLLRQGALVTVVAPDTSPEIEALGSNKRISLHPRPYMPGEAARYRLVFAATDDRETNRLVYEDADRAGMLVNVADDPALCSFHLPSRVERGSLTLSISSGGDAPFAVRRLRQVLERRFGPEWSEWMNAASAFREKARKLGLVFKEVERLYDAFFDSTVDESRLLARVPTEREEAAWLTSAGSREDREPRRVDTVESYSMSSIDKGFVSLVGGGPGDPGLLTVRGKERLMRADAVVCDRLAQSVLPCDLPDSTEIHFVGKTAGMHPVPQEEINAMLVRLALEGKRVVRLKGGDPFVFGRGGEEALGLVEASVPFEIVPGVTAAVAVPAYAGIPLTFRQEAVRVTLVTAHEAVKALGPQARWDLLAKDPHAVILGYMGVSSLGKVMDALMDGGMSPKMPAAVVERGTTTRQRAVYGIVEDISVKSKKARIEPPALFIVGPTACLSDTLGWFGKRRLLGERLVAFESAIALREELSLEGAELIVLPSPITKAARLVMDAMPVTGAILSSAEEADLVEEERGRRSWTKTPVAWCLSESAQSRASKAGWPDIRNLHTRIPRDIVRAMLDFKSRAAGIDPATR